MNGKIITSQTAMKNGVDLVWLRDFNYDATPNSFGWFDLRVISDDDFCASGEVLSGCAFAVKSSCPSCGEPNYEVFFSGSECLDFSCRFCSRKWGADNLISRKSRK